MNKLYQIVVLLCALAVPGAPLQAAANLVLDNTVIGNGTVSPVYTLSGTGGDEYMVSDVTYRIGLYGAPVTVDPAALSGITGQIDGMHSFSWNTLPVMQGNLVDNLYLAFRAQAEGIPADVEWLNTEWEDAGTAPFARYESGTVVIGDDIYCLGGGASSGNYLNSVEIYNTVTKTWRSGTPMTVARKGGMFTECNGLLYAVGGYNSGAWTNRAEVFNPATGTWADIAPLPTKDSHGGCAAVGGKVYVMGGVLSNATERDVVYEYDPQMNVWTQKASMNQARSALSAVALDGRIYVAGGTTYPERLTSVEAYDPATDIWTTVAPMSVGRYGMGVVALNGKLIVMGGHAGDAGVTAVTEMYDPMTDSWSVCAPMNTARYSFVYAVVNGTVYAISGRLDGTPCTNSMETWTPAVADIDWLNTEWEDAGTAPFARYDIGSAVIGDDIYCLGGGANSSNYLNSVEIYNTVTKTWRSGTPMTVARKGGMFTECNGLLYAVGGYNSGAWTNRAEVFNPATGTWADIAPLPTKDSHGGCAAVGGKVYVMGGVLSNATERDVVYEYDPQMDVWTQKASMNQARSGVSAVALDGRIYVAGGTTYPERLTSVEVYDPATDIWTTVAPMSVGRYGMGVVALNGKLIVMSGNAGAEGVTNTVEMYDPITDTWSACAPMNIGRHSFVNAAVNGTVYAISGRLDGTPCTNSMEAWCPAAAAPAPRYTPYVTAGPLTVDNRYTVVASMGMHGSVSPAGEVKAAVGNDVVFTVIPDAGYCIDDVLVDGSSVGDVETYTFEGVDSDHSISASFKLKVYTFSATAGAGGGISPAGEVAVTHGGDVEYIIMPDEGYNIADVLVDGVSVGAVASYTFENVTGPHTIEASFVLKTYTITATADAHGTISPAGATVVNHGDDLTYTMEVPLGTVISGIFVDGDYKGAKATFKFSNISSDHTIELKTWYLYHPDIASYLWLAKRSIYCSKTYEIMSGNIGVFTVGGGLNLMDKGEIFARTAGQYFLKADNIAITKGVTVNGSIYANTDYAKSSGFTTVPVQVPLFADSDMPKFNAPYLNDVKRIYINEDDGRTILSPGTYPILVIDKNAEVELLPGDYRFTAMFIEDGGSLQFKGHTRVFLQENFVCRKNSVVNSEGGASADDILFYYCRRGVYLQGEVFRANIYATNIYGVEITSELDFTGAIFAHGISCKSNAKFTYANYFAKETRNLFVNLPSAKSSAPAVEADAADDVSVTVSPNPGHGPMDVAYQILGTAAAGDRDGVVTVHRNDGSLVRSLGAIAAGMTIRWDGKDAAGSSVPAGIYLVRVTAGNRITTGRVMVTR